MTDRALSAAVIAVGDELLLGAHVDANSPVIAHEVAGLGRRVRRIAVVGDDEESIAAAVRGFAEQHAVVVITGGLGPTLDDVTRHGVAAGAGLPLVRSAAAASQLAAWYARAGREMPASNERQTLIPRGAAVLPNPNGTAPGFHLELGAADVFVLPGPPAEMRAMLQASVLPWLAAHPVGDAVHVTRRFHLSGLSESVFADRVGDWMDRAANPLMGVTVKGGVMSVRLIARGRTLEEAECVLSSRADPFLAEFRAHVFSEEEAEPVFALGRRLIEAGITLAVAESCTGGLVAAQLTRVPGISDVFREGFVTYSNDAKIARLGVPAELIDAHGAVSREVAEAMARGAARAASARLAVSVTGVAGPGGGTPSKPVGLVWFGVAFDGAVQSVERRYPDVGRERIREWASTTALELLMRALAP